MKTKEKEFRILELPETGNFCNLLISNTPISEAESTKKGEMELDPGFPTGNSPEMNISPAYLKKYIIPRPDGESLEQVRISAKTKYDLETVLLKIKCTTGKKVPLSVFIDNILREHLRIRIAK